MSLKRFGVVNLLALMGLGMVSCSQAPSEEIIRVSRQNNSGTYVYFRDAVLGKGAEFKLGSIDQSGSKDVVELVAKTPLAIGYSGMAYATPDVKMLKVSRSRGELAVSPTAANVQKDIYPIARPLFIYTKDEPKGAIKDYLDWIYSDEGQGIVGNIGYVPIKSTGPAASSATTITPIQVAGSDTMVNLAQKWAEAYGGKYGNNKIQVSGGGSGVGIAGLIDGTVDMANSSRKMKPLEVAKAKAKNGVEPREFVVGSDALAVYVHKDNPIDEISIDMLKQIYGSDGSVTRWSQIDAQRLSL